VDKEDQHQSRDYVRYSAFFFPLQELLCQGVLWIGIYGSVLKCKNALGQPEIFQKYPISCLTIQVIFKPLNM